VKRVVFLDRDGVINRQAVAGDYVTRWQDFHFLPGAAEAISLLVRAGWSVIVVTNQRCIAKGLLTIPELETIHRKMLHELRKSGAHVEAVYYCPHEKQPPCTCRKPLPGMLLTAAHERQIDLASSWMIGDSEKDVEAGKRAGCRTVLITSNLQAESEFADLFEPTLLDASRRVLNLGVLP
jgi:D-glycero-D-manno-heptose 1,7-bisphosphate phosphatase